MICITSSPMSSFRPVKVLEFNVWPWKSKTPVNTICEYLRLQLIPVTFESDLKSYMCCWHELSKAFFTIVYWPLKSVHFQVWDELHTHCQQFIWGKPCKLWSSGPLYIFHISLLDSEKTLLDFLVIKSIVIVPLELLCFQLSSLLHWQVGWRVWFYLTDYWGPSQSFLFSRLSCLKKRLHTLSHIDWVVCNTFRLRHHPYWPLLWSDPQSVTQIVPYKSSVILSCPFTSRATASPFLFSYPVLSEEFVSIYTTTAVKWAASHASCTSGCCTVGAVLLPTAYIQPCHPPPP